jgi:hypothetical protein
VLPTRPWPIRYFRDDVVAALLVVALAAGDRDLLDSVGMHDKQEPTVTDVCFEDVAVLTPEIAGEVKEPPASNAAGEGDRTHSGRMHYQAPFPQRASEYPRRARRSRALTHTHILGMHISGLEQC